MNSSVQRARLAPAMVCSISLLLAGASNAAFASESRADGVQTESMIVRFDDLNINSAKGKKRLLTRLKAASGQVCHVSYSLPLSVSARTRTCVSNAMSRALADIEQDRKSRVVDRGNGERQSSSR